MRYAEQFYFCLEFMPHHLVLILYVKLQFFIIDETFLTSKTIDNGKCLSLELLTTNN